MNKKILNLIERRLLLGEQKYGHQNITNNGRDFIKESLEEALDCCVYLAAHILELSEKEEINSRHEANNTARTMDT